jgi:hypothetical protein
MRTFGKKTPADNARGLRNRSDGVMHNKSIAPSAKVQNNKNELTLLSDPARGDPTWQSAVGPLITCLPLSGLTPDDN